MPGLHAALAFAALLVCALLLAACGADRAGMRRIDDSRLATPGDPATSPSGDYRIEVLEGEYQGEDGTGTWWRIRIRDRQGEIVVDSSKRFSARFGTLVLWDERVDRAWVESRDVGSFYWERGDAGRWAAGSLGPEDIVSGEPPVPRLLLEEFPEDFGPEGRERARRIVEQQGPSTGPLDFGEDDPRLMKPK